MWVAVYFAVMVAVTSAAYIAWGAYAVAHGASPWSFVAGLPLYYAAFPLFFTSVWVALGWYWRAPRPPGVAMRLAQRIPYFWHELVAIGQAPRMICFAALMPDPTPAPSAVPVLLLHGIGCNAAVWTSMRAYLDREGLGPVYALSYGPPFDPIETFAPQVAGKLDAIERATGAPSVVIVGHSMGGLVARSYIRRYGGGRVRRLVTVGTPHAGSMHAWLMRGASLTEMRPGSAYLAALAVPESAEKDVPTVSIWSWHDSMVTPQTSSRLLWADNIVLTAIAHNALIGNGEVQALVAAEIRKARADAAAPTSEFLSSAQQTPAAPA
ncbi:MAG TPA: alpha/beta fold hydrolase [Casimicrobiaceae bacterium]|nr:alpha/beta fold hydrolase [Casimicrobiaceae bacterium]